MIAYWASVDRQLGARVATGLGHDSSNDNTADSPATKEADELIAARANRA